MVYMPLPPHQFSFVIYLFYCILLYTYFGYLSYFIYLYIFIMRRVKYTIECIVNNVVCLIKMSPRKITNSVL